ncbi:MAG: histidinol-phosphate transaminase [Clostridiales bacterium]|nr:histidinol-phosphate transaminase [Clostridiales bacterium]
MSKDLFRKELEQLRPYVPGKPIEEVKREYGLSEIEKMASNENQLGPSPLALEYVKRALNEVNFYPESTAVELKRDLADYLGVGFDNIIVGNGAEELLSLIANTFINQGDEVVVASPSFGIYGITTSILGAKVVSVPFKVKEYDLDGMLNAINDKTKLVYLCNPNNPTGNIIKKKDMDYFFEKLPSHVVVILDEAYFEYAMSESEYPNGLDYLQKRPNTVVIRTFSKVYGLAGLRVGYLITSKEIADVMNKAKLTFNVNKLAQEAARGALRDKEHREKTLEMNAKSIEMMENFFDQMEFDYFKSYTNFIFVDVQKHSKIIFEGLMKQGVIVRPGYFWGWDNWIRVSTGTIQQTKKFTSTLYTFYL